MLPKSFKAGKCKTSLKLAVARIKLLKNKREQQVKQMRRELAQLLEAGQEQTARIRVEHVIREEKTMSAYDLIELYCELIVARLPIIESQKSCPIDLKEAISSVIFASPRCADIPELMEIRKHFVAKYGKDFINSALEVRPDCGVNRMVVEKLSARAPDVETKIKTLTGIAQEHDVRWDSQAFEEQLKKPNDDLLNGPNTFTSASKMLMESSNAKSSTPPSQKNESTMEMFPNDLSTGTPYTSVPFTSKREPRASESRYKRGEANNLYSREDNDSLHRTGWNMEFKDATSAAQAAAESAERASMAARAAADLASRGNISRQQSTGSDESSYGIKDDRPHKLRGSKLNREDNVKDTATKSEDEPKIFEGMKPDIHNLQRDEVMQGVSRRESDNIYDDHSSRYEDHSSVRRPPSRTSSHSSGTSLNSDIGQENMNVRYSRATSSDYARSTFDKNSIWDSDIHKHENTEEDISTVNSGEGIFGSGHKQPISSGYSAVVFDEYGLDSDDDNSVLWENKGMDSFLVHQGEEPSHFPPKVDFLRPKQQLTGSPVQNTSSPLHFVTESLPEKHFETMAKVAIPSQSVDSLPPTFDDSDGVSTEGEDGMDNLTHKETMGPSNSLHRQRSSLRGSYSEEPGHELNNAFYKAKREVEETSHIAVSAVPSDGYMKNNEEDSSFTDKFRKRSSSSSLPDAQPSPRNDKSSRDTRRGTYDSSTDEDEPQPLHSSKLLSLGEAETLDKLGMASSSFGIKDPEFSNDVSQGTEQGLNFGRLTGGLKHRGFRRPPYTRSSAVDASYSSKQTSMDTSAITEEPIVSHLKKPSASVDVPDQERYRQESHLKIHASKSGTSGASVDSDSDEAEGLVARRTVGGRSYRSVASHTSSNPADGFNDIIEKPSVSHKAIVSEDLQFAERVSYNQRLARKDHMESSPKSPVTNFNPDSDASLNIDKFAASHRNKKFGSPEVRNQEVYDQESHVKAYKETRPISYFDSDSDESEFGQHQTVGSSGNKDVKLSRRTRDLPSKAKKSSFSKSTGHSDMPVTSKMQSKPIEASSLPESLSKTSRHALNLQGKGTSRSLLANQSAEKLSVGSIQTESSMSMENLKSSQHDSIETIVPTNNENSKPLNSSGRLASRESSFKNASHIHPKLPDYESLAAHFHSLRSNRN